MPDIPTFNKNGSEIWLARSREWQAGSRLHQCMEFRDGWQGLGDENGWLDGWLGDDSGWLEVVCMELRDGWLRDENGWLDVLRSQEMTGYLLKTLYNTVAGLCLYSNRCGNAGLPGKSA